MPRPSAKMKIKKDGVTFESKVDACQYTLTELIRAALYDTAKYIRKLVVAQIKGLRGMSRLKRPYNTQYWIRKRETDLQIGFKHNTWYARGQELGDGMQRLGALRDTVYENIGQIQQIQAQYLSALNDKDPADPGDREYRSQEEDE